MGAEVWSLNTQALSTLASNTNLVTRTPIHAPFTPQLGNKSIKCNRAYTRMDPYLIAIDVKEEEEGGRKSNEFGPGAIRISQKYVAHANQLN